MRIAYILGSLNTGGTEKLLLDVFRNSSDKEFPVIGIYRKGGQLEDDFLHSGQAIFKLTPRNTFDIIYLFRLRQLLKLQKIELAHTQQAIDSISVRLASLGLRIKVVLTLHGFDFNLSAFGLLIQKIALRIIHKCIFVSEYQKQHFTGKYHFIKNKSTIVHNGLSFDRLNKISETDLRTELKISGEELLMGSVGNFVAGRNPLFICRFLKALKDAGINFTFIFVGKKDENEPWHYEQCVDFCNTNLLANIHFLGSRRDVSDILSQLDGFIYYSDHDTFGIAVIEAIAAGIPVFVNDWDVMLEITERGRLANTFHSSDELMDLILDFVQNRNSYKQKAVKASLFAKEKYSIQSHLNAIHTVYNNLN